MACPLSDLQTNDLARHAALQTATLGFTKFEKPEIEGEGTEVLQ